MSCCGQKRQSFSKVEKANTSVEFLPQLTPAAAEGTHRWFESLSKEKQTFTGSYTGEEYVFAFKGARVEVSHYDSFALMAEPTLKLIN